jgi:hypothetical protein
MPTKRFSARQLSWMVQSRPAISMKTDSAKSRELITKASAAAPVARRWLRIAPDGKSLPCRLYRGDISLPGECGANQQDSGQSVKAITSLPGDEGDAVKASPL